MFFGLKGDRSVPRNGRKSIIGHGPCCDLFRTNRMPLQAEVLHPLQNVQTLKDHDKTVCDNGLRS